MNRLAVAASLLLAGCAANAPPKGAGEARLPSPKAIAAMETGYQLLENIRVVGVVDSESMNREARTRVRNVACAPSPGGSATCGYEADRCLDSEQPGQDGWCRRTARFVPTTEVPPGPTSAGGWSLDRPHG